MIISCSYCGKEVYKRPSHVEKYNKNYCSIECRNKGNSKSIDIPCACCGKIMNRKNHEITASKTGRLFCSKSCSVKISNNERGGYGITQYRKQAFGKLVNKCDFCGYNKIIEILQVHHKDRNKNNNSIKNLQILCPNCHSEEHFKMKDGMHHFYS